MLNGTSTGPHMLRASPTDGIVGYTIVGFATLLVYDILCTLPDEVALVWSRAANIRSFVYFLNRYLPLIDTFLSMRLLTSVQPPDICERDFKVVTWMIVIGVFIAEAILMLRTWAIYEGKRWMLIFLCCLMACVAIPSIVVVKLELDTVIYGSPRTVPYRGCTLIQPTSVIIIVAYLLVLCSETIVAGLTIIKAIKDLRHCRSPLVVNLYRNGMVYFIYTLMISLANVLVPVLGPPALDNWLATPQRVLHSIFCARIMLSILRHGNLNAQDTYMLSTAGSSLGFQKPEGSEEAGSMPRSNPSDGRVPTSFDRDVDEIEEVPAEEVEMAVIDSKRKSGVPVASGSRRRDTTLEFA